MHTYYNQTLFILLLFLVSCSDGGKKEKDISIIHPIDSPSGQGSSLPYLFSDGSTLWMSWVEKEGDSLVKLRYSSMEGEKWHPAGDIIQGTDWFVNWADFPMIVANEGNLLSHVLKKSSGGTYSYDVKLNVLPDGSPEWQTDLPLHTENTATEHGFVSAVPYRDGTFFVTWLDGRNMAEQEWQEPGAMTIRAAEVTADGEIRNEVLLDDRTCECCQTTAVITDNGPVVIYRDRSDEEVRDISIVRQVKGEWIQPVPVFRDNWEIKGCPVNGPKAAVMGNTLAVAWFTAVGDMASVKLSFSKDGGAHFEAPIPVQGSEAIGRVDALLLDQDTALVSWMESNNGKAQVMAATVNRTGEKKDTMFIAELDPSRSSGFPQMERVGDRVYFAWTDVAGESSSVKVAFWDSFQ